MDASLFSSYSLAKNIIFVPHTTKGRIHVDTRRRSNQYQSRRLNNVPFYVVACSHESHSTSASTTHVLNGADWRIFRARLLAEEQTSISKQSSLMIDKPLQIPLIEDKWAHPIHEPEKGCLLIATEKHDGNKIYEKTVILLLWTGKTGLTGLILNRPSYISTKDMRSWALSVPETFHDRLLFFGGPLMEGLFLAQGKNGSKKSTGVLDEVVKGLYYGSKESIGLCDSDQVGDYRFFDGYCSWEQDELKNEISSGYWSLAACSPSVIGLNSTVGSTVGLWEEVNELMRQYKVC